MVGFHTGEGGGGTLAQCAASAPFDPATTWREYEALAEGGGGDGARAGDAFASPGDRPGLCIATRRGLTYVALVCPRLDVFATFPGHLGARESAAAAEAVARYLEGRAKALFADPCVY